MKRGCDDVMKYSMAKDQKEQKIERLVRLMFEAELYSMKYMEDQQGPAAFSAGFEQRMKRLAEAEVSDQDSGEVYAVRGGDPVYHSVPDQSGVYREGVGCAGEMAQYTYGSGYAECGVDGTCTDV